MGFGRFSNSNTIAMLFNYQLSVYHKSCSYSLLDDKAYRSVVANNKSVPLITIYPCKDKASSDNPPSKSSKNNNVAQAKPQVLQGQCSILRTEGKREITYPGPIQHIHNLSVFSSSLRRVVMCRARLGSKAQAWARLERAQASIYHELGLGSRLRLGPGLEEEI